MVEYWMHQYSKCMWSETKSMNTKKRLKRQAIREHNSNKHSVCVSNDTNSRLPDDLKSRIFIGNLNTGIITKRHLHLIFAQFGDIKAISMHKGYAFIQYNDEMDALNAVFAEDGQMIAQQIIDVNLVTEPKPHQKSSKPVCGEKGGVSSETTSLETVSQINSMENFENSIRDMIVEDDECYVMNDKLVSINEVLNAETSNKNPPIIHQNQDCLVEAHHHRSDISDGNAKRVKLDSDDDDIRLLTNNDELPYPKECGDSLTNNLQFIKNLNNEEVVTHNSVPYSVGLSVLCSSPTNIYNSVTSNQRSIGSDTVPLAINQTQAYDILICGNCRNLFTSLSMFIQHKRSAKCRLRFVCHCQQQATK